MELMVPQLNRSAARFKAGDARYQQSLDTKQLREEARKSEAYRLYEPLVAGLRPLASRPDLTDAELLREFRVFYHFISLS